MGALPRLVAHGGVAGAAAEMLVALAVLGVFVEVWLRERRERREVDAGMGGTARLRDEDEPPAS